MRFPKRLIAQTPECLTEPVGQVLNVIISTLFALVFLTAYVPFSETAWFQVGKGHYFFITAAFVGAGTMFLVLSRMLMNWVIRKSRHFPFGAYLLWLFLEIMIIAVCLYCLGCALHGHYFGYLAERHTATPYAHQERYGGI